MTRETFFDTKGTLSEHAWTYNNTEERKPSTQHGEEVEVIISGDLASAVEFVETRKPITQTAR
jgi:hypothetical protein